MPATDENITQLNEELDKSDVTNFAKLKTLIEDLLTKLPEFKPDTDPQIISRKTALTKLQTMNPVDLLTTNTFDIIRNDGGTEEMQTDFVRIVHNEMQNIASSDLPKATKLYDILTDINRTAPQIVTAAIPTGVSALVLPVVTTPVTTPLVTTPPVIIPPVTKSTKPRTRSKIHQKISLGTQQKKPLKTQQTVLLRTQSLTKVPTQPLTQLIPGTMYTTADIDQMTSEEANSALIEYVGAIRARDIISALGEIFRSEQNINSKRYRYTKADDTMHMLKDMWENLMLYNIHVKMLLNNIGPRDANLFKKFCETAINIDYIPIKANESGSSPFYKYDGIPNKMKKTVANIFDAITIYHTLYTDETTGASSALTELPDKSIPAFTKVEYRKNMINELDRALFRYYRIEY